MNICMTFRENGRQSGAMFREAGGQFRFGFGDKIMLTAVKDYEKLDNLPSIEGVPLIGDISFTQLHLEPLSNAELEALLTL